MSRLNFDIDDVLKEEDIVGLAKLMDMSMEAQRMGKGDEKELHGLTNAIQKSTK